MQQPERRAGRVELDALLVPVHGIHHNEAAGQVRRLAINTNASSKAF